MKPIAKMNSVLLSMTSAAVFGVWANLSKFISTDKHKVIVVFIGVIFSVGFYNLLLTLLNIILNTNKLVFLKKLTLGSEYVQGCWVGFFIRNDGKPSFFYEIYEQTLEKITVRGTAFNENGVFHCNWISNNVNFDSENCEITYYYSNDSIANTHKNTGIASFVGIRTSKMAPITKLRGYSSDLFNPKKLEAQEIKVSDFHDSSDLELFKKAQEFYNDLNN